MRMRLAISWDPWGSDDEIELQISIEGEINKIVLLSIGSSCRHRNYESFQQQISEL